jgi:hypothetical protein
MSIPNDRLRLYLTFRDGLQHVEVLAPTNRFDRPPLCEMGEAEGDKHLEDLLNLAGIDRLIISSGEPFTPSFKATAFDFTPKQIVEHLKKSFDKTDAIDLKILRGEELTEDEESFRAPVSLTVCASTVQTDKPTLDRIADWLKNKR